MDYHAAKAFILDILERELPDKLTYHGLHHTLDVLHSTEELCYFEHIPPYESILLKTAALFHDSGFTIGIREHERLGCLIVHRHLPRYGYSPEEIKRVCGMVMATRIPQTPHNRLEKILCDADLDYLGREDFHEIGNSLFQELQSCDVLHCRKDWNRIQVQFLENHCFFTPTNKRRRTNQKERYLKELKKIVASYEKK
jgi:uncharacterized protein